MCHPFCTLSSSHQNLECRLKKPRLQGHYSPALLYQPPQKWVSLLRFHAFSLLIALYKIPLPWEGHCRTKMKAELISANWVFLQQKKKKTFSLWITLHCDPAHNTNLWYFSLWVVYCLLCICMAVLSGSLVSGLEHQETQWFLIFSSSLHCRKKNLSSMLLKPIARNEKNLYALIFFIYSLVFTNPYDFLLNTKVWM